MAQAELHSDPRDTGSSHMQGDVPVGCIERSGSAPGYTRPVVPSSCVVVIGASSSGRGDEDAEMEPAQRSRAEAGVMMSAGMVLTLPVFHAAHKLTCQTPSSSPSV